MISKADAQMAIQAAPAARPAITSLAKCVSDECQINVGTGSSLDVATAIASVADAHIEMACELL
jgi:hypothetical protein